MDFELTPDQTMLQDVLQRFVQREYAFERRQAILGTEFGCSAEVWQALAEQGVLGIGLPEAHGGFGGPVEVMLVMEQLGRALVLEPFLSTVVLGGGLVAALGTPEQQQRLLPQLIEGRCRLALAHYEPGARYALDYVQTIARARPGGVVLSGAKNVVLDGAVADRLIVSAREEDTGALSLFLVAPDAPGVERVRYRTQDGRNAADVRLLETPVEDADRLGAPGAAAEAVEWALDRAIAALCAEAVGIIEMLNAATLEYLKTREQFGQPIGRFQVLQHRMADMFLWAVQARSMSLLATARCALADRVLRRHALSAAKAYVGQAARFVGQQAVQLHGGMGLSAELPVGHAFKRLTMLDLSFGNADHHLGLVSGRILGEALGTRA